MRINTAIGGCGAEILDLDLKNLGDNSKDLKAVQKAFADHGVLFFRDQRLSEEDHIAFAELWGDIDINRFFAKVDGYPEIASVTKTEEQTQNIGGGWHTDHSYDPEPAMGSILVARELPESGGDTLFADMYKAWETLSPGLRETLMGMKAVHSAEHIFGAQASSYYKSSDDFEDRIGNPEKAGGEVVHPVAIKHPLSGRTALYVNAAFTLRFEGWTPAESAPLLTHLYRHASSRLEHSTRFQWQPGSVAFWDNRATWHYALNDYHGQRRIMHRITLAGCRLEGGV